MKIATNPARRKQRGRPSLTGDPHPSTLPPFHPSVLGFHHTSFTVSNLAEAERFFVDLFGMERVGGGTYDFDYIRRIVAFPDAVMKISVLAFPESNGVRPPHRLELIEYAQPPGKPTDTATNRPGNAHLCLQVENIHAEYDRLAARGVRFKSPPQQVTWGINKGAWGVYFNGPDGVALELFQPANGKIEPRITRMGADKKPKQSALSVSSAVNNK